MSRDDLARELAREATEGDWSVPDRYAYGLHIQVPQHATVFSSADGTRFVEAIVEVPVDALDSADLKR